MEGQTSPSTPLALMTLPGYRLRIQDFVDLCQRNHLLINAGKTNEAGGGSLQEGSEHALPAEEAEILGSSGGAPEDFVHSVVVSAIFYGVVC
ncbi:hypothetical protein AMECASPLE_036327 [Ameca splendens]|uniref:Uncharacterized protein n=1 Tax=Ameca splendens TaxID=208324 RepID=A0ABV0Z774_9TELE